MKQLNKEWMESMQGKELWTSALGERECIGFDNMECICLGKRIKPTAKQIKIMQEDQLYNEYGTTNFKTIMKMEGVI